MAVQTPQPPSAQAFENKKKTLIAWNIIGIITTIGIVIILLISNHAKPNKVIYLS